MGTLKEEVNKVKVLAVDDVEENIELIDSILSGEEFEVSFAPNGKDALKKVEEIEPDVILLDVNMPEMDGYEVCRRLKKRESTKDIPVIFLTAKAEIENIIEGFEIGGKDYITKPFSIEELMARIRVHTELAFAKRNIAIQNKQLIEYNETLSSILNLSEELFEKNIDAILWIDKDGDIIKCNSAAAELFECKRGELIGVKQEKLYYEEVESGLTDRSSEEWEKEKCIIETKIITKKGYIKSVRVHLTTINYNNQPIQQGTFVDITRQKKQNLK